MKRPIAACLGLAFLSACTVPHAERSVADHAFAPSSSGSSSAAADAPAPSMATSEASSANGAAPGDAAVLVRLLILDTNARAPAPLPDDRSFLRGATAALATAARCRASTGSKAHWVEIEWRVDDAGKVLGVMAHPVFIPPQGRPPAVEPETLRCIESSAASPPFTASRGRPTARVLALVGFELPDLGEGPSEPGLGFVPEPDGHCRRLEACPPTKRCEAPPRVRCPRAGTTEALVSPVAE